jgi:hypothetical protein
MSYFWVFELDGHVDFDSLANQRKRKGQLAVKSRTAVERCRRRRPLRCSWLIKPGVAYVTRETF